jgi:cell wall-associated NlpC family hydrolase
VRRLRAGGAEEGSRGPRGGRRGLGVVALVMTLVAAGGAVAYSQAAGAAPSPTIAEVQAKVNSLQSQIDQVGNQYDQVSQQVTAANARLVSVQKQDGQAEARYLAAQSKLRQVAVASYETGNQSSIAGLFTSADPEQVLRQASLIEALGSNDSGQVALYLSAAQQVETARQNVQRTQQGVAQLQGQLKAKKSHLNQLLSQSQAELDSLNLQQQEAVAQQSINGSGSGLITHATDPLPTNTPALKAVQFAYEQLGCWYLWGGTGPCSTGFDCSGLVQAAWASAGVSIERTTYQQFGSLPHVSKADLQPGDIVFFESLGHEGMYVGNGLMIDAPTTGQQVRLHALDMQWYAQGYVGAARP